MDIKAKIDEIVNKLKSDDKLMEKFQKEPVKAVESIVGVDLPDDQIGGIVDAVKAKLNLGSITDKLGGLFGK